jgi:hypothetical protein
MRYGSNGQIFWIFLCSLVGLNSGCKQNPEETRGANDNVVEVIPYVPASIEITDVKARYDAPEIAYVQFEYRFTSGHPLAFYQCDIKFPDSGQGGVKEMQAWELKDNGVIKTGFNVTKSPGNTVEITIGEAETPDKGYKVISNKASGAFVETPPTQPSKDGQPTEKNS